MQNLKVNLFLRFNIKTETNNSCASQRRTMKNYSHWSCFCSGGFNSRTKITPMHLIKCLVPHSNRCGEASLPVCVHGNAHTVPKHGRGTRGRKENSDQRGDEGTFGRRKACRCRRMTRVQVLDAEAVCSGSIRRTGWGVFVWSVL